MFKEKYCKMNENISPSRELMEKIINKADKEEVCKNKVTLPLRRPVLILCALLICLFTAIPVLAANVSSIYELMYLVSPSVAQSFVPVQKSCVSNGIEMQVVSAYIHGDTAEIYITMQDLEGNRIDETTDLNDSYSLRIPFDSSANCQLVGYDEATKTATFLISITEWGNKKIAGDKLTFSVNEFLSHKQEYSNVLIKEDLSDIKNSSESQNVSLTGWSGQNTEKYISDSESVKVLKSSEPMNFPVSGIDFTGIGYIDGSLHVQTSVINNLKKDNHGFFQLKDKKGNVVECDYNVGFVENADNNRIDYDEYVFNIPKAEIQKYSLYGDFVTSGMFTEGKWTVTFPLENADRD
ncbi:MAG: hypothetical protein AB9836_10355 [Aminipila sp.]